MGGGYSTMALARNSDRDRPVDSVRDRSDTRRWFDAPADRPALISDGEVWSAAECRTSVEALADYVRERLVPVQTGQLCRVVVYGGATGTTCLAWLAALQAGAVATVLDERLPVEWSAEFVRRIRPQLVLHDATFEAQSRTDGPGLPRLDYGEILGEALRSVRAGRLKDCGPLSPRSGPATTIYSSGSTGEPKEVLLGHETLNGIAGLDELWGSPGNDGVVAVLHPLSMLSGPNVLTGAWRNGRTVVTYDIHRNGYDGLVSLLHRHRVTDLLAQTAVVRSILRASDFRNSALRRVAVGGEPVRAADIELFNSTLPSEVRVRVVFGMSECPLVASTFVDASTDVTRNLRFRAHGDVRVQLVDDDGRRVDHGAIGELLATSPRISRGYVREGLVVEDRFVDLEGTRWFRTGDCAQLASDGTFELCGRVDSRLKIRGYNVYPEAVEVALGLHPSVREAVVVGSERPGGGTMLTAFVVPATAPTPSIGELRTALRSSLPDYCVPSVFVVADVLPTLPNGKRDRELLRRRASTIRFELNAQERPRNSRERHVERLVAELLGLETVGIHDDLLDLGMDSLMLAELAVGVAPAGGPTPSVASLVRTPTISGIAALAPTTGPTARLVRLASGTGSCRVVLVPGAGASIAYLRPLAERLEPAGDLVAFVAGDETSIADEARSLCSAVQSLDDNERPIVLVGHSWGGVVAQEAARRLRARGHMVRLLVLLDSAAPSGGSHGGGTVRRIAHALRPEESLPPVVATNRAAASLLGDRRFAANVEMAARHRARHVDVRTLLIRGVESRSDIDADRWSSVVGTLVVEDVPGSHTSLLVEPSLGGVAETIAGQLEALLRLV
jgi:acyl-coenzyme A synthetase/AMP-(fatty) acid ligase/thioesterase domain-containing protein/aryl carrier-like protein